jgi:glutamine amidotransferase
VASTAGHALSVRAGGGSVLLASEPLDDDAAWTPVPDGHLVVATTADVRIEEWESTRER